MHRRVFVCGFVGVSPVPADPAEGVGAHGVTGGSDPPDVSAGNQTWDLERSVLGPSLIA